MLGLAGPAAAQLKRDAWVQPVGTVRAGDALLGLGASRVAGASFSLSGLRGDLVSLPVLHAAWAVGPRAVFEVRGAARQSLSIRGREGDPVIPLDPAAEGDATHDAGDFELSVSFAPLRGPGGLSAGGHLAVKLPNSDEARGIGTNTTDVTVAGLLSWASSRSAGPARWGATGWGGVGILQAPLELFEQNDVFAYAVESWWRPGLGWRLSLGTRGRMSTRRRSPLGTEDTGELRAGIEWRRGRLAVDGAIGRGLAGGSGTLTLHAGAALLLAGSR